MSESGLKQDATVERHKQPLSGCVRIALEMYFKDLDGGLPPENLYQMVLDEVELPLLEVVMKYTGGNQSKAAKILGLNRTTLRKKLKRYKLD
ncbi:MAG: DNA-binding transcriptional regulator Fis [Gammaproteobacteria bacterium]|nr:DNA-binding transcriptional regulator Fis [Gammaproteobacteria bacterium]